MTESEEPFEEVEGRQLEDEGLFDEEGRPPTPFQLADVQDELDTRPIAEQEEEDDAGIYLPEPVDIENLPEDELDIADGTDLPDDVLPP